MAETDEAVAISNDTNEDNTAVEVSNKEETKQDEYKVFVGNLAFSTDEDQLTAFFNKIGKVVKANIITRGTRSLGYGFVALETEEDAKKVVDELNKQELDGRQINVEVAKPKTEGATAPRRGRPRWMSRRGRGRGRGRGGRGRGRWFNRRRFANRSGEGADEGHDATAVTNADAPTTNGTHENDRPPKRRGGGWYRRAGRGRGRGRGGRPPFLRRRHPHPHQNVNFARNGEPSKTHVFVANLPFSIDDEGLKDIFRDYNVSSAHVVRRRGGRSKGFGFVELADEEEQKKALEGLKEVESEGRKLVIKVALSDQQVQSSDDVEKSEAPVVSDEKKED